MSCSSSQMPSPNVLCYSPGQYYHFRCEVQRSLVQVWKVDGVEMFRLGPISTTADFFPTEPLNFLVHQVIITDNPLQTTFVSYLWFNSSNFVPTTVTCESATQNISVTLERYGTSVSLCVFLLWISKFLVQMLSVRRKVLQQVCYLSVTLHSHNVGYAAYEHVVTYMSWPPVS